MFIGHSPLRGVWFRVGWRLPPLAGLFTRITFDFRKFNRAAQSGTPAITRGILRTLPLPGWHPLSPWQKGGVGASAPTTAPRQDSVDDNAVPWFPRACR